MDLRVSCPVMWCGVQDDYIHIDVECDGKLIVHRTQYYGPDRDVGLGPEVDWDSITAEGCNHTNYELWNAAAQQRFMDSLVDEYNNYDPT
jgi:hypothetical protein